MKITRAITLNVEVEFEIDQADESQTDQLDSVAEQAAALLKNELIDAVELEVEQREYQEGFPASCGQNAVDKTREFFGSGGLGKINSIAICAVSVT